MGSIQYTVRAVPGNIDRELRRRAKQEQRSLNAVILDALARAFQATPHQHTDLDSLIGCWEDDPAFDDAVAQFERIDQELWP